MLENADNLAHETNKKHVSEIHSAKFSECNNIKPEDATCVICLDEYEPDSELRILRCGHHYHKECVDNWLIEKGSCCLCHQGLASGVNMYRSPSESVGEAIPLDDDLQHRSPSHQNSSRPMSQSSRIASLAQSPLQHRSPSQQNSPRSHVIQIQHNSNSSSPLHPRVQLSPGIHSSPAMTHSSELGEDLLSPYRRFEC